MATTFTITQSGATTDIYLYPDANSSVSFTAYGEANNWECVDDIRGSPDEDGTYVHTTLYDTYWDRYTLENASASTSGTINYIRLTSRSRSSNYVQSSTGSYNNFIDAGTAVNYGINHSPISASYVDHADTWVKDPDGATWTWSTLNENLRAGVQCSSPSYGAISLATYLYPNSAGASNFFKYPNTGDDYEKIDERVANDNVDYLWWQDGASQAAGDNWAVDNIPQSTGTSGTIDYVEVYGRFRQVVEIGVKGVYIQCNSTASTLLYPTEQWQTYSARWYKKPGGVAWKWSDIETATVGWLTEAPHIGSIHWYCTQLYMKVQYTSTSYSPRIHITSMYATANYTPDDTVATLNQPSGLQMSHSRNVGRHTFSDGAYEVDDYGRAGKTLTLNGQETSGAAATMQILKNMVHNGVVVIVAGLDDTNLNMVYHIADFSFSQEAGMVGRYLWNLVLEED